METLKEMLLKEQERLEQIAEKARGPSAECTSGDASPVKLQTNCPVLSLYAGRRKERCLYSKRTDRPDPQSGAEII